MKFALRAILRFIEIRLLHINDSPHRLALGVALGLFVAWLPLYGLHLIIVLSLTLLFGANKFTGLASTWANNPFTVIPIYYLNYLFGKKLTGFFHIGSSLNSEQKSELLHLSEKVKDIPMNLFATDFWRQVSKVFMQIGVELTVGSVILGLTAALLGYVVCYHVIIWYRQKYPHRYSVHQQKNV